MLAFLPFLLALDSRTTEEYDEMSDSEPPQPYYLEAVEITGAKDVSGVDGEYHFERDTAILMSLDIGKDFEPELYIGGNFKCDWDSYDGMGSPDRIKPLDWGSNFKVDELAARGNVSPLFDPEKQENVIRDEVLEGLIGQTIIYARYIYGYKGGSEDLGYTSFDRVRFPNNFKEAAINHLDNEGAEKTRQAVVDKCIELAKQSLEDQLLDDIRAGYVKDYDPSPLEDDDEDDFSNAAGDGAPSSTDGFAEPKESGWDNDETFEPDDEMPF